jgi:ribosomal-protein-alanine N-acetyltransferase
MIQVQEVYQNLPRLETERLTLRKLTLDDLEDVYAYSSDPEVTRYLRWGPHASLEQTESYIREVLQEYKEGRDGPWGIEHRASGHVVGAIHLMGIRTRHRRAEIRFLLSRAYWGKGLMVEALLRVLRYAFEEVGLNRVEALCLVDNLAAIRVLEKAGMKKEGVLREYAFQKGAFGYSCVYSMLRRDYEESSRL